MINDRSCKACMTQFTLAYEAEKQHWTSDILLSMVISLLILTLKASQILK